MDFKLIDVEISSIFFIYFTVICGEKTMRYEVAVVCPGRRYRVFVGAAPYTAPFMLQTQRGCLNSRWVPGIFPGGRGCRSVGLTTLPPSCADLLEMWEPQPLGPLSACSGLYRDCFILCKAWNSALKSLITIGICIVFHSK